MFSSRLALSLPQVVTFSDGSTIRYMYSADGTKLKTTHVINGTTTTTDYCGNVIYENGTAKKLLTDGGYVDLTTTTPTYYYYLTDHQGNNRAVVNSSGIVQETNHYYPFGGLFATNGSVQPYKYNGKELDTKKGLNLYDYGARHYDAALGRWHVVDPLAEKMGAWSTYAYCYNNPMKFVDEDGMFPGPGDLFNTPTEAAKDWGMYYNGTSILEKREKISAIYEVNEGGEKRYSYTKAITLGQHGKKNFSIKTGEKNVALIHSHGNYDGEIIHNGKKVKVKDNDFSASDKQTHKQKGLLGYLTTPNGSLLMHDPTSDEVSQISTEMPSDPNDPGRLNNIAPTNNIEDSSIISEITDFIKNLFK